MSTRPRTIAGRYRVLEEAGRGGMGSVWRCVDERLGREVAVKQVGRLPGESATDQARALREARSTAALNHRNVVSVYDAVVLGDHVWLVMEYVAGRTLSELVREEGPLDPVRVARIGAQVAEGLAAAHERGIVHRDVKPGNVLVTEGDLTKISDFGIARTLGDETLTQSGMVTGTPAYFAPELARGGDPTPASDVWALGATLYTAVEGHSPFPQHTNALALLATIAEEQPLAMERAGVLAEPIAGMLDRDPESRWSVADVTAALHGIAAESTAPGEAGETADTRHDTAAVAAATAPAPAPGSGGPVTRGPEPGPPAGRDRRRRGPLVVAALVAALLAVIVVLALVTGDPAPEPAADDTTDRSASAEPDDPSSSETTPSPSETTEDEPESTPEATPDAAPASSGSRFAFVEDYYALLPEDTAAAWELLSPEFQDRVGSYEDYDGFWSTIDDVVVTDTRPGGAGAVDATLVYTDADGEEEEQRRLFVDRGAGGWQITGDEVLG